MRKNEVVCQGCGKPLTGKQKKWCSYKCYSHLYKKKRRERYQQDPEYQERRKKEARERYQQNPEYRECVIKQTRKRRRRIRFQAIDRFASRGLEYLEMKYNESNKN